MTGCNPDGAASIELVTDQRRRNALRCLRERDGGMALADLATDVAAMERDESARDVPPEVVERVYVSLYHCHVPKLEDGDVVEYHQDRNVVSLASESERLNSLAAETAIRRRA